ncbi:adenosylcobinamide-GDP ribazoletransferase [Actinoalloteichus hoggarensis]|uniref:Adenosylcobinamide-GDP ribazoletransferase n=1 Tax=Actinoalloteichus hoggarensis TaxID=1470176 RepID=A0A221WA64_9PSEU|nr:adenosylcobinamide-GDP ribazoletransferase [Actinoalloteichus hoggarensis]ASO22207.1 Cobalamin synthase [Actinoalloteichus hoggarensis]MBB5923708.1 adenosylcobinamide-GDP ribazoletransferase [Actinoalloteichus hoggarensis]
MGGGLRLALSWLTVLPVPTTVVDARTARHAITLAPLVGGLLGLLGAGVLLGLAAVGVPSAAVGLLVVGFLALATRGMHLDGLADTADGLGCYGPRERALAVMRDGGAGPFAVVTLVVALGVQAAALAALAEAGAWHVLPVALAAGRAAFVWCARRGVPAARPDGLGALVAGGQRRSVALGWWAVILIAAAATAPQSPWAPAIGVAAAFGAVAVLSRHTTRRFGGMTGDVLGAACETAVTIVLVAAAAAH